MAAGADAVLVDGPAILAAWRPDVSNATDPVTGYRVSLKSLARCYLELTDEIADLEELINPILEASHPNSSIGWESASKSPAAPRDGR